MATTFLFLPKTQNSVDLDRDR
uniref:Uncharacterized protein n=1 Tax=Arundo donax TaxID=35708 RepID=A0A0A9FLD2_ARUDO